MGEVTLAQPLPAPATPPGSPPADRAGRLVRLYWLWPALLTLGLGLWWARRPALWADELATWGALRLHWGPLRQLLGRVDAAVGPYYVLLKVWTGLAGTGNLALRLPSIGAMALTAAVLALLGARLTDRSPRMAGLLTGLLFAVVPATSRYAQEARPYAFTILFACLATLALTRLVDDPSWGRVALYALCVALLGAFHLVALLLLPAHAVAVLPLRRGRLSISWAIGAGAALALLSPLAILAAGQRDQIAWIRPANWRTVLDTPDTLFAAGASAGAIILLAVLAVSRRWPALLLGAWALVPPLALLLVSLVTPLYWARYLLFTLPAWVVLAGLALARMSYRRAAAVVVAVALLGGPTQHRIRLATGHLHATSTAGGIIAANEQPGDALVVALHEQPEPWEARDIVARYVPAARRPIDVFAVRPQRTDGHLLAVECPDLATCLDAVDPPRIWVIRFESWTDPLFKIGQPKEDLLRARYHTQQVWLVRGLTVALLVRN